jgi:imidazolonepropionase-like amidohydrolase
MRSLSRILLAIGVFAVAELAHANANIPPIAQQQPVLITGATLHPVSGPSIANGRMLIDKGRIVAIGNAASVPDQANTTVIDFAGKHIYPGLIAAHTTLGLVEVQAVRATVDSAETGAVNPNSRALVAVNADSELLPVTRANGVLTALSVPQATPGGLIAGTSALIQLDGWTWEEMGLIPDVGLHIALPSLRFNAALYPSLPPQRLEEMQRVTQQRLRTLEDAFESASAYAKARANDAAQPIDSRWEAMADAINRKRPVFIAAEELAQIRYALNFGERFNLRIVIVGGMDAWRIADLLRDRQVPVIIGGVHRLPLRREEDTYTPFRLAARLSQAGVKFCIARSGSNFDAATERSLPYEAATAAAHGLARDEALKAITLYPAQILGAADKLGSLERGKLATFIVTNGDPLDIRTQVERIYIQGRDVPLTDKQTKLNDKYEEKYRRLDGAAKSTRKDAVKTK